MVVHKSKRKLRAVKGKSKRTDPDTGPPYAKVLDGERFGDRRLNSDDLISFDGKSGKITVNTIFGDFSFVFEVEELRNNIAHYMKREMNNSFIKKLYGQDPSVLDSYSEQAYDIFVRRFSAKMEVLPHHLVQQILFALVSKLETDEIFIPKEKSAYLKLWNSLMQFYGHSLKEEWTKLRPGRTAVATEAERAAMLDFYNSILPDCQSAKSIYKKNRKGHWRTQVKDKHKDLDDDDIENLIRMKPSEVGHVITGKHFKKIIGKDFKGEAEVKRQLGIARSEKRALAKEINY
jgi:hypothetical protein